MRKLRSVKGHVADAAAAPSDRDDSEWYLHQQVQERLGPLLSGRVGASTSVLVSSIGTSLRRVAPLTRVLAVSGGGNHLRATDCLAFAKGLGAHGVLMKPFNRAQLLAAVNKITPLQP